MNDISFDLETLSTRADAAILSIGAVAFGRSSGVIGERFSVAIDLDDAIKHGHVSGSTIEWWMQQTDEARAVFLATERKPLAGAMSDLSAFMARHPDARPWGNGATFDISILENAYREVCLPVPWAFFSIRDMRTILDVAETFGFSKHDIEFEGEAHNALDDATHQARVIAAAWDAIVYGNAPPAPPVVVEPNEEPTV